jgi:hypothetical protein
MPRYMLDTIMCIFLIKNQPEIVAKRFAQCYDGQAKHVVILLPNLPSVTFN